MPTINIPDKMCIKCGSTRWRVNPKTGYKRCTDCSNANTRKNYKAESHRQKCHKKPELYRKIHRRSQKKYRDSNKAKIYPIVKEYLKEQRESLGDLYIKSILTKHHRNLSFSDISPELIELKRKQLLLIRKIKSNVKNQM